MILAVCLIISAMTTLSYGCLILFWPEWFCRREWTVFLAGLFIVFLSLLALILGVR
jgi:hypothetical protein